ncbi:hypothetical protein [Nisaea sp.]|uniref:hypothetical protein n=1 Tax=Nisaea sp. TaxID=2024842 RepID=UPI003B51940D
MEQKTAIEHTVGLVALIEEKSILATLTSPDDANHWDAGGQHLIRNEQVGIAATFFKRAEILERSFNEGITYRYALTLELLGEFDGAAKRYRDVIQKGERHSRDALYRAVGCLHRLQRPQDIVDLLHAEEPGDWQKYAGLHMTAAWAFACRGFIASAVAWVCWDSEIHDRSSAAADVLKGLLRSRIDADGQDATSLIFPLAGERIFQIRWLALAVIRWLINSQLAESLACALNSPDLIRQTDGKCLSYTAAFMREWPAAEDAFRGARLALLWRPDDPAGIAAILPHDSEFEEYSRDYVSRWARAAIVTPNIEEATANDAVIVLKMLNDHSVSDLYVWRAADRFRASPPLLYNAGSHLNERSFAELAEPFLKRAIILAPDYAKALSAYSVSKSIMLESQDGVRFSKSAIAADPRLQSGYTNLAMACRGLGDVAGALEAGLQQLRIAPTDAIARMGVAFNQLTLGAIEQGFENYRVRWAQKNFPSAKRSFPQREWMLQKLPLGKKALIYMEQGMGDELMFSWFLKYAEEVAPGQIVVECDYRLLPAFQRSFPDIEFLPRTTPVLPRLYETDILYKVPIGHLPSMFCPKLRALIRERWALALKPHVSGYGWIQPDHERVEEWRRKLDRLGRNERVCIGVAWRSQTLNRQRKLQYLSPLELAHSLPENAIAVNLQYVYEPEELEELRREAAKRGIDVVTFPDLDLKDDLSDVIDLCGALDAIVTPLISTAFMGGTIGTPTWVFRSAESKSLWQQLGTPHIPWIPSIRVLFRDPREPWDDIIVNMRSTLTKVSEKIVGKRQITRGAPGNAG